MSSKYKEAVEEIVAKFNQEINSGVYNISRLDLICTDGLELLYQYKPDEYFRLKKIYAESSSLLKKEPIA